MNLRLEGKSILVTGGSKGSGLACAAAARMAEANEQRGGSIGP